MGEVSLSANQLKTMNFMIKITSLTSLFLFLIDFGCSAQKKVTINNVCCNTIYTDFKKAISAADTQGKLLLVSVFGDHDSQNYNRSMTTTFQLNIKDDKLLLKNIDRNYILVKLYQKEFKTFLTSLADYEHTESYMADANEYRSASFFFLSAPNVLSVYSPWTLKTDKEEVVDNIHVGMGP